MKKRTDTTGMAASDIQQKYGVSRSTAWRAGKRGWIVEDYHTPGKPAKKGAQQQFCNIISQPAFNMSQFTSVSKQKILDVLRGKSTLKETEWTRFKAELAAMHNAGRAVIETKNHDYKVKKLKAFTGDARIKKHVLFDKKMLDRLRKDMTIYSHEITAAEKIIKNFLDTTQI